MDVLSVVMCGTGASQRNHVTCQPIREKFFAIKAPGFNSIEKEKCTALSDLRTYESKTIVCQYTSICTKVNRKLKLQYP